MIGAGIDIGTNTILMVIGEHMADGSWRTIDDVHSIARLGEGVDATGVISDDAIVRASEILSQYRRRCDECGVHRLRAVATSAMRDARNSAIVRTTLSEIIGTEIEVIEGGEEARLTFRGTVRGDQPSMAIDIGGGSTEIVCGHGSTVADSVSMNIGAVRLTERYFAHRPPPSDVMAEAIAYIDDTLRPYDQRFAASGRAVFAAAGTPTALATLDLHLDVFDAARIDGHLLTAQTVHRLASMLVGMDREQLRQLPAVHPKRIDILPAGALLLDRMMQCFGIDTVIVSTCGVRYGVLFSLGDGG
ncbi:MAG: exopolyphosphatase [Bacteroidetes bacterium]|nr:exopolyphosphatase [Bacteroidota bacterium]